MRAWMTMVGLLCAASMVMAACSDDEGGPGVDGGGDAQVGDGGGDDDGSTPDPVTPAEADDVLITEIMASANCGDFEWIEIHNPSDSVSYNLNGCMIADREERVGDATEHHVISTDVIVPPGGYVVLAETDDAAGLGFTPDYNYGGVFGLSGGGENPAIGCGAAGTDGGAPQIISVLEYDAAAGDNDGLTAQLDQDSLLVGDTVCSADPADVYASCPQDGGAGPENAGTPGADNRACPIL